MKVIVKRRAGRITYVNFTKNLMLTCYKLKQGNEFLRQCTDCTPQEMRKLDPDGQITVNLIGDATAYFENMISNAETREKNKTTVSMEERKGCMRY